MSWWATLWLCVIAAMFSFWMIGPPISYAGLFLWYIYDLFPSEKPYFRALFPYSVDIRVTRMV